MTYVKKPRKIYMFVTMDEYELPLAIADSPHELAEILNVSYWAVYKGIGRYRQGQKSRYVEVKIV